MSMRPHHRGESGQDLLEYALVLPLLMLLLLGIMEVGVAVFRYNTIANAAREGARFGIIHPEDDAGITTATRRLTTGLNPAALQIIIDRPSSKTIQVEVTYDHNLITGLFVQAVGGNPLLPLHTSATMIVE